MTAYDPDVPWIRSVLARQNPDCDCLAPGGWHAKECTAWKLWKAAKDTADELPNDIPITRDPEISLPPDWLFYAVVIGVCCAFVLLLLIV